MRLFVALRPPPHAVADLESRLPRWPSPPSRWHVTLAFLGDADPAPVHDVLARRLPGRAPFELALEGSGSFGASGPVWVGVGGDVDALHALAREVASAARSAGVELESRRYRPHLTVGRRGRPDPAVLEAYRGPTWTAEEVELVRSDLGREVRHTVLERYPLTR